MMRRLAPGLLLLGAAMPMASAAAQTSGTTQAATTANIAGPTITYRKVFKSSYPEFTEVKVTQSGACTADIRSLDDEASPQACEINPALAEKIFNLAAQLHDFNGVDLDVHRRIANLGQKTLQYESGAEKYAVTFNYTVNESATQLVDIFEGLAREEMDLSDLQRTMRYDRLGVNDVLIRIESDYTGKLLPDPQRLLPLLDQIAGDDKYIGLARQKSRALAEKIRATT
ncbi:MAG TPA: hypothetical protein VMJ93_14065 [Verrucomicrobiae bacterium]|nr:hypothetical protein [Verrucomicrobiae bacterium]